MTQLVGVEGKRHPHPLTPDAFRNERLADKHQAGLLRSLVFLDLHVVVTAAGDRVLEGPRIPTLRLGRDMVKGPVEFRALVLEALAVLVEVPVLTDVVIPFEYGPFAVFDRGVLDRVALEMQQLHDHRQREFNADPVDDCVFLFKDDPDLLGLEPLDDLLQANLAPVLTDCVEYHN